jgi:hypothetical protein
MRYMTQSNVTKWSRSLVLSSNDYIIKRLIFSTNLELDEVNSDMYFIFSILDSSIKFAFATSIKVWNKFIPNTCMYFFHIVKESEKKYCNLQQKHEK